MLLLTQLPCKHVFQTFGGGPEPLFVAEHVAADSCYARKLRGPTFFREDRAAVWPVLERRMPTSLPKSVVDPIVVRSIEKVDDMVGELVDLHLHLVDDRGNVRWIVPESQTQPGDLHLCL